MESPPTYSPGSLHSSLPVLTLSPSQTLTPDPRASRAASYNLSSHPGCHGLAHTPPLPPLLPAASVTPLTGLSHTC